MVPQACGRTCEVLMNKQSEETKAVGETATFTDREEVQGGARAGRAAAPAGKVGVSREAAAKARAHPPCPRAMT